MATAGLDGYTQHSDIQRKHSSSICSVNNYFEKSAHVMTVITGDTLCVARSE